MKESTKKVLKEMLPVLGGVFKKLWYRMRRVKVKDKTLYGKTIHTAEGVVTVSKRGRVNLKEHKILSNIPSFASKL